MNMTKKNRVAMAILAGLISAGAAPAMGAEIIGKQMVLDISLNSGGKSATVTAGGVVNLSLYAYVLDGNANPNDTGFLATQVGIQSTTGGLIGNLGGMTLTGAGAGFGSATGNNTDLDSDGDLDLGAAIGATSGHVIASAGSTPTFTATSTGLVNPSLGGNSYTGTYSKFLLGTFTFTAANTPGGTSTSLALLPRTGAGAVSPHKFTLDSTTTTTSLKGNSTSFAVADPVTINLQTGSDGFSTSPTVANTNVAVGGAVHVVTNAGNRITSSEIDQLTSNVNKGSVTADNANATNGPTTVLLWLADSNSNGGATIATLLSDLQASSGGAYTILLSGNAMFDTLNAQYGNDATAAVQFTSGLATSGAFNWDFSNSHSDILVDRIAVAPEPTSLGLLGLASAGLLTRKRRAK